jgi:hypothetical protein
VLDEPVDSNLIDMHGTNNTVKFENVERLYIKSVVNQMEVQQELTGFITEARGTN